MMSTGQNALRRFGDSLIGCWGDRTLQSERESLTLRELLDKPWMRADTAVGDAARYFADTLAGTLGAAIYTDKYLPIIRGQPPEHPRPFLSVVMRTQLYRPETLTEALLIAPAILVAMSGVASLPTGHVMVPFTLSKESPPPWLATTGSTVCM